MPSERDDAVQRWFTCWTQLLSVGATPLADDGERDQRESEAFLARENLASACRAVAPFAREAGADARPLHLFAGNPHHADSSVLDEAHAVVSQIKAVEHSHSDEFSENLRKAAQQKQQRESERAEREREVQRHRIFWAAGTRIWDFVPIDGTREDTDAWLPLAADFLAYANLIEEHGKAPLLERIFECWQEMPDDEQTCERVAAVELFKMARSSGTTLLKMATAIRDTVCAVSRPSVVEKNWREICSILAEGQMPEEPRIELPVESEAIPEAIQLLHEIAETFDAIPPGWEGPASPPRSIAELLSYIDGALRNAGMMRDVASNYKPDAALDSLIKAIRNSWRVLRQWNVSQHPVQPNDPPTIEVAERELGNLITWLQRRKLATGEWVNETHRNAELLLPAGWSGEIVFEQLDSVPNIGDFLRKELGSLRIIGENGRGEFWLERANELYANVFRALDELRIADRPEQLPTSADCDEAERRLSELWRWFAANQAKPDVPNDSASVDWAIVSRNRPRKAARVYREVLPSFAQAMDKAGEVGSLVDGKYVEHPPRQSPYERENCRTIWRVADAEWTRITGAPALDSDENLRVALNMAVMEGAEKNITGLIAWALLKAGAVNRQSADGPNPRGQKRKYTELDDAVRVACDSEKYKTADEIAKKCPEVILLLRDKPRPVAEVRAAMKRNRSARSRRKAGARNRKISGAQS